MASISAFDIASCVLILIVMASGFARGSLRQATDLLALYVGTAVSAQYTPLATQAVRPELPDVPIYILGAGVFLCILTFVAAVLVLVANALLQPTKPRSMTELDQAGGAVLGAITASAFIAVCVPVIRYSAAASWGTLDSARETLLRSFEQSFLLPFFEHLTEWVLFTIKPLLPSGIPDALLGRLPQV